jgi:beta-galactosidase/beta-glucuronidase
MAQSATSACSTRRLLAAAAVTVAWITAGTAAAHEIASPTRQALSLDGEWQMAPLPTAEASLPLPAEGRREQRVPSFLNVPDSPDPQKAQVRSAWLKRSFAVPADWRGKHVRLESEAVSRWSKVYLNGEYLGEHLDLFPPLPFDVPNVVQYGQENEVAVWVTMEQTLETCSNIAGMPDLRAGIWQSVRLAAYPLVRAEDVFVITSVCDRRITARVTLANATDTPRQVELSCEVRDWSARGDEEVLQAQPVFSLAGPPVPLAASETKTVDVTAKWESPTLWTPDSPHLYVLTTTVAAGGLTDVRHGRFGFREFWVDGTHLVLNGIKVFLPVLWGD